MDNKYFYYRKLPHWQPPESTFFITYRLADSVPSSAFDQLKLRYARKEISRETYFKLVEAILENRKDGPHWMKNPEIAKIILDSLIFNHGKLYKLLAACVMSNHVHVVLQTLPGSPLLHKILQHHKRYTAVQCNKVLKRYGQFWEEESYDALIRDFNHLINSVRYTLTNPIKAGLVKSWFSHPFTYLHPSLHHFFK